MVYTSGTGGRPKGVVHAQRAAWARRMMWDGWYGLTPDDRVLHAGAFNWTYTLGAGLTDPWAIGATALIYAGPPDRGVWPRLAAAHGATIFAAVPGVYRQMLESGRGPRRRLRRPAPRPQRRRGAARGGARAPGSAAAGRPIYEALGMSEVSTYVSFAPARPPVPGRAGRPQRGRRVAILADDGRRRRSRAATTACWRCRGAIPGLMLGYWRRPEETAAAFRGEWFVTGDRARMAADGTIAYLGRADDLMNAGGYRVSPAGGRGGAAAPIPASPRRRRSSAPVRPGVTVIAAFYVPRRAPVPEAELAAHCARALARYKCPRAFHAVAALPRGANGKLLRRKLREVADRREGRHERSGREGRLADATACASSRRRSSTSTRRRRPA